MILSFFLNRLLELTLPLLFGDVDRVLAGETAVAEGAAGIPGEAVGGVHGEVGEGISADLPGDLLHAVQAAGDQVLPGVHVRAEEAGITEGRGRDAHMDFLRSGFPQEADDALAGGAADDGVVNENHPLVPDGLRDDVQLDADGGFPHVLAGGNEAAADVFVLQEAHAVGNAAFLGVAQGGVDAGVRHADDHVRFHRVFLCEEVAGAEPGLMNRHALDDGVGPGKIDILKHAQGALLSAQAPVGNHAFLAEDHDFPGIDIPDELRPHGVQGTRLRGNHPGPVRGLAVAQGPETVGIPEGDELGGGHQGAGIGAQQLLHGAVDGFLRGGHLQALGYDGIDNGFGIRGTVEDAAGELVAGAEGTGVDQVAVMAQGHVALHMADDNRLDVVVVLAAGGGITDVAHGDVAFAQAVQARTVEDFAHQAVAFQVMEHAVAGNRDAAAFLTPVLQGVEPKVHVPGNGPLDGRPDAEYAALLMHKAGTSEKRERRPSA